MSFTDAERGYLAGQPVGRLATVGPDGAPQNNPVGFTYNAEAGTIDIGGLNLGTTRKFRNIRTNDQVSLVVDDVASFDPWRARGIEIRGRAEALAGQTPLRPFFSPEVIRIHPRRILAWGIEPDSAGMHARDVQREPRDG